LYRDVILIPEKYEKILIWKLCGQENVLIFYVGIFSVDETYLSEKTYR